MTAVVERRLAVRTYGDDIREQWDGFVGASKNGTFLFARDYMEYHSKRFEDHSLLISDGTRIVAVMPANRVGSELYSHGGLTYGGIVSSDSMTTPVMLEVFDAVRGFLKEAGIATLFYKTIPSVYHRIPAEEDRYALFRAGATLYRRDVLSVVLMSDRPAIQERRRRGAAKAKKAGVVVARSERWADYWTVLSNHLEARYGTKPVHSLAEIELLRGRFPEAIALYTGEADGEVMAGVVMFGTPTTAHAQYIVASDRGREIGALDAVFMDLLTSQYPGKRFFDFGISNEDNGLVLNKGLIEQKEGFGARAIMHDFYSLDIR